MLRGLTVSLCLMWCISKLQSTCFFHLKILIFASHSLGPLLLKKGKLTSIDWKGVQGMNSPNSKLEFLIFNHQSMCKQLKSVIFSADQRGSGVGTGHLPM